MTTAAASSSFCMQSLKCINDQQHHHSTLIKISISCSRTNSQKHVLLSHNFGTELRSVSNYGACSKRILSRVAAAVAQEESTATVEDSSVTVVADADDESAVVEREEAESVDVNTKLYFGNLPYHCDSAQLAGIIQEYGSPELIEVLHDRDTGKSMGFAFVTMSSIEDCNIVIENLDGSEYGGRTLRVNFSDKPKPKVPLYPETEYKLFVGHLSWSVTSEILTSAFQSYDNVVGARVLYDGETGKSRGYGFVSYETRQEMEAALEALNREELEGRSMRISLAQGKKQ